MAAVNSNENREGQPAFEERGVAGTREEGADGARTGKTDVADAPARRAWRIPLSFLIARYFFYVLAALAGVWLVAFTAFSMTLNAGLVYSANYGAAHANEAIAAVQEAGSVNEASIPSAYRYAHVAHDGTVLATDLSAERLRRALDATTSFRSEGTSSPQTFGIDGTTYSVGKLADGTFCILTSTYMPEYTTRELRDTLPNPQNLMIAAGCAGSALAVALIARRASSVLAGKMLPLTDAAERIGKEELDFAVGTSNVRQIDDVLAAMERMRYSLADSLEARWRAEQAQRDQIAALAHDLKTPLTVVRANAEFVAEETQDLTKPGVCNQLANSAFSDVAAAAQDAAQGCKQVDRYVQLLIEASRGKAAEGPRQRINAASLAEHLEREVVPLARTTGMELRVIRDDALGGASVFVEAQAVERAVANVVSNAVDHARSRVRIAFSLAEHDKGSARALAIDVEDDGPGFSPAALEHGCERFFRDDASRTGAASGTHYGIGLFAAAETARNHNGTIELANLTNPDGSIRGARVTLQLPLA
ncbi:HAMP domain-containing histidine kinase [Enorma massiliensis]|uniref:ATP-binding protein n=1 Tax=Enorma massiliensis TaxID=1472761 RepID=UPI00195E7603|nr:HAMP domain-containing histidine kinase [Enorma massiliensis]